MSLLDTFVEKYGRLPTEFDPDYLEMLRMSKYRMVPVPDNQPGRCANCGASKADGRSYVDFGLDVAWHGTVFLCSLCLEDIARNVGLFQELEQDLKLAQEELQQKEVLLEQGKRLQGELSKVFEEVKSYIDDSGVRPYITSLPPHDGFSVEPYKEPSSKAAGEGDRPVNDSKQRTTKSTPSPGPKDLLSLTERLKAGS